MRWACRNCPKRIECFDISHIQGAETVASMVVWEDGGMKKSDYRKFIIRTVAGVDDFASMREVVTRRYKRLQEEKKKMPSLMLIDGGLGQLHAAAQALEALEIINQPLAAIAKREEIIYVYGQEDEPVALDHHSPVLHLVQLIRDEAHRFAVTFHRKRRQMRDRSTELREIPGVGASTTRRLLEHFGSVQAVKTSRRGRVVSRRDSQSGRSDHGAFQKVGFIKLLTAKDAKVARRTQRIIVFFAFFATPSRTSRLNAFGGRYFSPLAFGVTQSGSCQASDI